MINPILFELTQLMYREELEDLIQEIKNRPVSKIRDEAQIDILKLLLERLDRRFK